jgi:hypothetical protein
MASSAVTYCRSTQVIRYPRATGQSSSAPPLQLQYSFEEQKTCAKRLFRHKEGHKVTTQPGLLALSIGTSTAGWARSGAIGYCQMAPLGRVGPSATATTKFGATAVRDNVTLHTNDQVHSHSPPHQSRRQKAHAAHARHGASPTRKAELLDWLCQQLEQDPKFFNRKTTSSKRLPIPCSDLKLRPGL